MFIVFWALKHVPEEDAPGVTPLSGSTGAGGEGKSKEDRRQTKQTESP